jgi:hypothetical protein
VAKLVTGLFKNRITADAAIREVSQMGYTNDDVSVLMSDATKSKEFGVEAGSKAAQGATVGGVLGGAVGAGIAALVAVGTSIALPGLGLIIAGPIAAALAGAGRVAQPADLSECWLEPGSRKTGRRSTKRVFEKVAF